MHSFTIGGTPIKRSVSEVVIISHCHCEAHGFESRTLRKHNQIVYAISSTIFYTCRCKVVVFMVCQLNGYNFSLLMRYSWFDSTTDYNMPDWRKEVCTTLRRAVIQKGAVLAEMACVWVNNPSSGTLWAKVIEPKRETDVSHSLKQVGGSTPAYFLKGM